MSGKSHPFHYETHHRGTELVPYDGLLGVTVDGVPVMSNGDESHFSSLESITPSALPLCSFERMQEPKIPYEKLGFKWQCVEFARRYLASRKAVWMTSIHTAAELWTTAAPFLTMQDAKPAPFQRTANKTGGPAPAVSDIIVWGESEETPFGHVAVVVEVCQGSVRVAEQNQGFERWPEGMPYSREIPLQLNANGSVELVDMDPVLGWVTLKVPDYDVTTGDLVDNFRLIVGPGQIIRQPFPKQVHLPWIRPEERCDYYLKRSLVVDGKLDDGAVAAEGDVPGAFYFLDYDMWCRIGRAANSLHSIAMKATARVLEDPESAYLLEHYFGVPPAVQPLLRHSWEMTPPMGGRFDFGYDGKRIVMLEYNCDSSGALLECCDTQEKMANHYKVTQGTSTGSFLGSKCVSYFKKLMQNEKACPKHRLIHFMIDEDDEERYTAMCMMNFAEKAGFRTKLCVKLVDFQFRDGSPANAAPLAVRSDHPTIIDQDGEEVLLVWKTWSWDTVLHQYINQRSSQEIVLTPTLSDILLNSNIRVLEPLWKAVTGSKAILPFMHALAPDHQHMLTASFTKTREIMSRHFISKPVNGRAGQNIMMFDPVTDEAALSDAPHDDMKQSISQRTVVQSLNVMSASPLCKSVDRGNECSTGKFFDSVVVYQQRLFLKKFDQQYFPIFCGWMIDDEFSGVVVREDTSKITKLASVVTPARVVRNNVPLGVAYADAGET